MMTRGKPREPAGYGRLCEAVAKCYGESQTEQAAAMGLTQSAISRKMAGKPAPPVFERHALAIAAAALELSGPRRRREILARAEEMRARAEREMEMEGG